MKPTSKLRIGVLFHRNTLKFRIKKYTIHYLASVWRSDGHEVIYLFGTEKYIALDICIIHVDLSVVPRQYMEFANQYPIVINGKVDNIQKTNFSRNLVSEGDNYSGKVIVKTNDNYCGWPEILLRRNPLEIVRSRMPRIPGSKDKSHPCIFDYRIFDQLGDVPGTVFQDSKYVVEKFLPDFEDGHFHVNLYAFLGESHQFFREASTDPIVKYSNIISSDQIEPDPEVIEIRRSLKFDYGKFDYCYHEGELILLDINKTVGMGNTKYSHLYDKRARALYEYVNQ